jgi:isoquinoline 1-oxidoreductase alpha subunit
LAQYNINVNGTNQTVDVDGDTPLLWVLRDSLGLVGTKYGCGIDQCGACTIHIEGVAMRSCALPISRVQG